ncbi:MAG: aminotransferase [Devosia sp.]|uniref:aminotransferase class III-fold pyridoxal phosphate-dependent enzyme n=1 Tax=Devosia sp. TaxID=1871048 RepID=UPI002623E611|nr:aminotransferase class III-fold pyridoxal phosphate-dependent enzyme [Devosia sp.]MDB5526930.1 aminotransferase [Devosia sp.]
MKTIAIVQARMASSRLPGKVLRDLGGRPMIDFLLARLAAARQLDAIVLATSTDPRDDELAAHVAGLGHHVARGSQDDVLDRYYQAARNQQADIVVRVTGDCPLMDSAVVDRAVAAFKAGDVDYASNVAPPTFPDGIDIEVFSFGALERAWNETRDTHDREHVTPYIRGSGKFRTLNVAHDSDESAQRWTVDEFEDLEVVRAVVAHFAPRTDFGWEDVLALSRQQPELFAANRHLIRNEGSAMGSGQKLWKRAKRAIPGGNMLLSKRAEMFLPDQWPAYFSKTKGCRVWDMDGRELIDMSIMGVGTNTLGYGHPEVDAAVMDVIAKGNMSTLNAPEEVYLAERLIELHPWADMVRFARSGGEANAIAIRIARAASGRDKVAICGYHGWHDWYLAANLGDDETLAGHLLPGLAPNGVPQHLRGSVLPFNYNRFDELLALVDAHDIGVIKMEVSRNRGPENGFLDKIRKLATERNIVLIFDECTSGFRQTFGGLHKLYGVEPDMAIFGKTLGNGYAITATIGRREVMQAAQSTFISSTFWTERIGSAAGLATLEVMARTRSWETITAIGSDIRGRWQSLADKHGLKINHWGLPALCGFTFVSDRANEYKTLITQEMLAKGYLAGDAVYACIDHTPDVIEGFFDALDPIFATIASCEDGRDVTTLLHGPVAHERFKRLN